MPNHIKPILIVVFTIFLLINSYPKVRAGETQIITSKLTLTQDVTWDGTVIIDGAEVDINQGATLTIKPGTIVAGKNGGSIFVMGKLKAIGEKDKKVRFNAEDNPNANFSLTYSIYTTSTSELEMKNFILENGGGNKDTAALPALTIKGKANLTDGIVRRNRITALRIWNTNFTLDDCEIYENESIALENKTTTQIKVENNWWGSQDQPKTTSSPNGNWLSGNFDFDPWQKKGPIPIIILPGFGGSFSFRLITDKAPDSWWMTPVGTSAYRYFEKALTLSNYENDEDFFWGFYDWRKPNEESAKKYLEAVLDDAKSKSGHLQVHILAHSMGGLVARSYIQGNRFRDDVDRLVTAGTPHWGSSETYPIWEGGLLSGEKKPISLYLWYLQALNQNWNRVDYIQQNFPSVGQMLPIYDYLIDSENNHLISYKNQKERNDFLTDLDDNKTNLKRRATLGLIAGTGKNTLEKIRVNQNTCGEDTWRDGIPDPFNIPKDTIKGDGTVTVDSATGRGNLSKEISTIESDHGRLFEKADQIIFNQLKVPAKFPLLIKVLNHFILSAQGPVEVQIEDEQGRTVSNSKNEIADSQYFEQGGAENKLIYSDFPQEVASQEVRKIKAVFTGEDEGNFKAAFWHLSNNDELSIQDDEHSIGNGITAAYQLSLRNNGNGDPEVAIDKVVWSNLLIINYPKSSQEYLDWQYLTPEANIWQGAKNIENLELAYEVNNETYDSNIDLGKLSLGIHHLKVIGSWKANGEDQNEEKEVAFSVSTSCKSLMTLTNRFYEENKIISWQERSRLINILSEAYQESSNGKVTNARGKINEAINVIDAYDDEDFRDSSIKEKIKNNLDFLKAAPS